MITLNTLRKLNACKPGLDWFARKFPAGCAFEDLQTALIADGRTDWLGWAAANLPKLSWQARMAAIDASDNPAYWRGCCAAYSPVWTWTERMAAVDASNNPAYWRGYCAVNFPHLVLR